MLIAESIRFPSELLPRYSPVRVLGQGGMGVVVLAEGRDGGAPVVVKVGRGPSAANSRRRALREGEVLQGLRHPGIVRVFEFGEGAEGPYVVMEYLQGEPFSKPLSDPLAALAPVVDALEAVHQAGLLHRDVKPENIIRCDDGRVVLVDFGLALGEEHTRITATGQVVGTIAFMAPETLRGQQSTPAVDWYGWGATLYWMLTGKPPLDSSALIGYATGDPAPAPNLETIPVGSLRELLARTLEVNPDRRADAPAIRALIRALEHGVAADTQIGERSIGVVVSENSVSGTVEPSPTPEGGWTRGALAVGFVALAGLSTGWWTSVTGPNYLAPEGGETREIAYDEDAAGKERRHRFDQALETMDELLGTRPDDLSGMTEEDRLEILDTLEPRFASLRMTRAWNRLIEASYDWVTGLPESSRMGSEVEAQELVFVDLNRRTAWFGWIRDQFSERLARGRGRAEVFSLIKDQKRVPWNSSWDETAIRDRLTDLSETTRGLLVQNDLTERRRSPLFAKLMIEFSNHIGGFHETRDEPKVFDARRRWICAALHSALESRRGKLERWRNDLHFVLDTAVLRDFTTPAYRVKYYRSLWRGLEDVPRKRRRLHWTARAAAGVMISARCFEPTLELRSLFDEIFVDLRALCEGLPEWRNRVAGGLLQKAEYRKCYQEGWIPEVVVELKRWRQRGL